MPSPPALPALPKAAPAVPFCPQPALLLRCLFAPSLPISGSYLCSGWRRSCWGIILELGAARGALEEGWGSSLLLPPPPPLPAARPSPPSPQLIPSSAPCSLSSLASPVRFRDELQATNSSSWIFAAAFPAVGLSSSLPARWADPCWNSGRSFPHLSTSRVLVGAPRAECSSRGCGNAAREAQGCSGLWGIHSRGLDPEILSLVVAFPPFFCHPRGAGSRNNSDRKSVV